MAEGAEETSGNYKPYICHDSRVFWLGLVPPGISVRSGNIIKRNAWTERKWLDGYVHVAYDQESYISADLLYHSIYTIDQIYWEIFQRTDEQAVQDPVSGICV